MEINNKIQTRDFNEVESCGCPLVYNDNNLQQKSDRSTSNEYKRSA